MTGENVNAVTTIEGAVPPSPAPAAQTITMMDIINRAIFDPAVPAEKVERLGAMALQFKAVEAKEAYARAMIAMKPQLPIIERKGLIVIHKQGAPKVDANIIQSTPYARWEDIDAAITPILAQHGFVLTFRTGAGAEGRITVTGILTHEMGHSEESTMPLPLDTSGSKNNVQAAGSSTSYGKRYTATMLLNIRTKGEDDDGNEGGRPGCISDAQAERILELLTRDKADVKAFCAYMKVAAITDIPASEYTRAIEVINTRSQKVQAKAKANMEAAQ
jgi:hypothetical protein